MIDSECCSYIADKKLGSGGQGTVYLATQGELKGDEILCGAA